MINILEYSKLKNVISENTWMLQGVALVFLTLISAFQILCECVFLSLM